METIVKQYTKENALSHILNVIAEKGYEVSINGEVVNKNILEDLVYNGTSDLTTSTIKKLNRRYFYVTKKSSEVAFNNFFNFLKEKKVINDTVVILDNPKAKKIQSLRVKMKTLRDSYEKALLEYKTEKGDFYKK
jgi:hypothetical protein